MSSHTDESVRTDNELITDLRSEIQQNSSVMTSMLSSIQDTVFKMDAKLGQLDNKVQQIKQQVDGTDTPTVVRRDTVNTSFDDVDHKSGYTGSESSESWLSDKTAKSKDRNVETYAGSGRFSGCGQFRQRQSFNTVTGYRDYVTSHIQPGQRVVFLSEKDHLLKPGDVGRVTRVHIPYKEVHVEWVMLDLTIPVPLEDVQIVT